MHRSLFAFLMAATLAGTALADETCTYTLSSLDLSNVSAAGATSTIVVTTPAGCPVTATSFQPWVQIIGIAPNGDTTTVTLGISVNSGQARATSIILADRLFLITQTDTIVCPGFGNTRVLNMDWANPVPLFSDDAGSFGPNDALVVIFTTGNVSSPDDNLPHIAATEWDSNPSARQAVLSATPCDFGPQTWPGASASGSRVTVPFAVGSGANFGYYPIIPLNTTYYFNIKNVPEAACTIDDNCNMVVDLVKPAGM